jgi:manganese transport protein
MKAILGVNVRPFFCAVDPGNWATDLAAGSAYGYDLLCAILLANICAIFFQVLI